MGEILPSVPEKNKPSEAVSVGRDTKKAKLGALKAELPNLKDKARVDELARTLDQSAAAATPGATPEGEVGFLDSMKTLVATLTGQVKQFFEQLFGTSSSVTQSEIALPSASERSGEWQKKVEYPDAPFGSFEKGVKGVVTSAFGPRLNPFNHSEIDDHDHVGIDISAPKGTKMFATGPGVIVEPHSHSTETVRRADGTEVTYHHFSEEGPPVGTPVAAGDFLGAVGSEGRSTGPHLHMQAKGPDGRRMDPLLLLPPALQPEAQTVAARQKQQVDALRGGESRLT